MSNAAQTIDWQARAEKAEWRQYQADQLCGEIIACLRANYLRGTLTTQDDTEFEWLLARWEERLSGCGEGRVDCSALVTGRETPQE